MAGGARATSLEAIERFFEHLTLQADGVHRPTPQSPCMTAARRKQIEPEVRDMAKQNLPIGVFCTQDMMASAASRYPASVPVGKMEFSLPSAGDDAAWRETQKRVAASILADKAKPSEKCKTAVGLSPAAKAFAAEFKLPGQGDAAQAKPMANPTTSATTSPEKKPTHVGMKPATAAFVQEFSLPQSK